MRKSVLLSLWLLSSVWGCAHTKPTPFETAPPSITEVLSTVIHQIRSKPIDDRVSSIGLAREIPSEVQALVQKEGYPGLRKWALSKGYYLQGRTADTAAIFSISARNDAAVIVKPIPNMQAAELSRSFIYADVIDGQLLFVISEKASDRVAVYKPEAWATRKKQILAAPGYLGVRLLGESVSSTLAQTRYAEECTNVQAYGLRTTLFNAAGPALAHYNNVRPPNVSAGLSASLLARSFLSRPEIQECPLLLLPLFANSLAFTSIYDGNFAFSSARVAFVGKVAAHCAGENYDAPLEGITACAVEFFSTATKEDLITFFSDLGQAKAQWDWALNLLFHFSEVVDDSERDLVIQESNSLGLQVGEWLDKVGYKVSDLPQSVTRKVEVGRFVESGDYKVTTEIQTVNLPSNDLPINSTALDYDRFQTCNIPIYWDGAWWRACKLE